MNMQARKDLIEIAFTARFGDPPTVWSRAPGRVDLMGSHTDYNQGFALSAAVSQSFAALFRARSDGELHVFSNRFSGAGPVCFDRTEATFTISSSA